MYELIYDYNNLLDAWRKTQRLKKYRPDVIRFRRNLDEHLITIQNELVWQQYRVSDYRTHYVYEPKKRLISVLPLRDRIAQHALCSVIEPGIDRQFIFDSHACRKGHGVKLAIDRFVKFSRRNKYCLTCDISSYFYSIQHDVLMDLYRMKISCEKTLNLVETIIDSTPNPGIPIGNLISQLSANLYLNELDRFIKHEFQHKDYIRYMDDFVLFGDDYGELKRKREIITTWLKDVLHLTLSTKKSIVYETANGVDFCGFRCYPGHATVKKSTRQKNRRYMLHASRLFADGDITAEDYIQSLESVIGHSMYSRNYTYRKMLIDSIERGITCTTRKLMES